MLFEPFHAKNFTVNNRFFKAAMHEAFAKKDLRPNEKHIALYDKWAQSGAGILMTGNIMVDRLALAEPGNVAIEDEHDFEIFKRWAAAGKKSGNHIWMQLNHPGKQAPRTLSKVPVSPSALPLEGDMKDFFNPPRALTEADIWQIIARFAYAAGLAKAAGFTGLQIHAAHGYLVSQFLSPKHNKRQDQWGGTLENRGRFLLKIYEAIRSKVGDDFPVAVKLNAADFQKGGFTLEDALALVAELERAGVDLIELSGGNYENPAMFTGQVRESTRRREAYFLDFAEKVRQVSGIPLVVTGGFLSEAGMREAIESGAVDFVGVGKAFILRPDLPAAIAAGSYETVQLKEIRTGLPPLDKRMRSMLELAWYERQMDRLSRGLAPKPNLSVWTTMIHNMYHHGLALFDRRRA